jgi:hypothetical protein
MDLHITSALMTMVVLLGLHAGSKVTAKSRWIDLISGITLTSRDVIGKFSKSSLKN